MCNTSPNKCAINITVDDYIQSAMYIDARNKMLCLYNVK